MRTRVRASLKTFQGSYRLGTTSVVVPVSQEVSFPETSLIRNYTQLWDQSEICVDDVTPGYFRMRRENEVLPIHNLSISKKGSISDGLSASLRLGYDVVDSAGKMATKRRGTWEIDKIFPESPLPTWHSEFPREQMLQEALANLRSELWDVGTFMAEFSKTAEMVTTARARLLDRIERIAKALEMGNKRRRWRNLQELLDRFFELWMEGRYGWRLLYYDLLDAQEAYQRLTGTVELVRKRYTVTRNLEEEFSSPWEPVRASGASLTPFDTRWSTTLLSRGRAGCIGHIDLSGATSVDPLVTAWEVIPFTMVADWFFNVGEALQAWSPFAVGKLDGSFFSKEDSLITTCEVRVRPTFAFNGRPWRQCDTQVFNLSDPLFLTEDYKTRMPLNPSLDLSFRPNISGLRIVDAAALTWLLRRRLLAVLRLTRI